MRGKRYTNSPSLLPAEREHYVIDNQRLVYHILNSKLKVPRTESYYDDYVQEGMYALTLAAIRYDETTEVKFSTFASTYIEGYMRRYRREFANSTIRIPRAMLDSLPLIYQMRNEGYDDEEIANQLNMNGVNMSDLLHVISPSSLDAPVSADTDNTLLLADVVRSENIGFDELESDDNIDYFIQKVADSLKDDKKKGIWYDYIYSAVFDEPIHQDILAKKYNLSQSYIARILNDGKTKLRRFMKVPLT